jgi:4-hydroxy-2-oxoheptanedioate aldolase
MLRAAPRESAYTYARVGGLDPAPILRLLDSGARGIIAPTIESGNKLHARKRPYPGGNRASASRPNLYAGQPYTGRETRRCPRSPRSKRLPASNARKVSYHPGLTRSYRSADLAVSYGPRGGSRNPVRDAIVHLSTLPRAHGVTMGVYQDRAPRH